MNSNERVIPNGANLDDFFTKDGPTKRGNELIKNLNDELQGNVFLSIDRIAPVLQNVFNDHLSAIYQNKLYNSSLVSGGHFWIHLEHLKGHNTILVMKFDKDSRISGVEVKEATSIYNPRLK